MTAIGTRKDHIFQGILLGRPRHPLMLAALLHCFGPTFVDQQDLSGFRYVAFCEELFRVIKADRYQEAGSPLKAGWVLGCGFGPIYLLQETHEPALKTSKPKGLHNDVCRTAGGQRTGRPDDILEVEQRLEGRRSPGGRACTQGPLPEPCKRIPGMRILPGPRRQPG